MPEKSEVRVQTKRHPGPPGWGLGMGLSTLSRKENVIQKPNNRPRKGGNIVGEDLEASNCGSFKDDQRCHKSV
jgi:hypothetical protein